MAEKQSEKKNDVKAKEKLSSEQLKKLYVIILIVVCVVTLVIFYFYRVNNLRNQERMSTSYLLSTQTVSLEIKNLEEANQILKEAPNEYFILISYVNNKDTYNLEKGLKSIIDNYSLSDRFYYFDATELIKEDNYLERLNNAFDTNLITKVPVILYYQGGKLMEVVLRSDNNPINAGDFQRIIDIYE